MKMTITDFKNKQTGKLDFVQIAVFNDKGQLLSCHTFNTTREAHIFVDGFNCAKYIINGLVQSLPMAAERITDNSRG